MFSVSGLWTSSDFVLQVPPGNQTETILGIQSLHDPAKTSQTLRRYFNAAYESVKQALDEALDGDARSAYHFVSWLELEQTIQSQAVPDVVLRTTALCFAQFGHLIRLLETHIQLRQAWEAQTLILVASCAGQIPAALAATTQSLDQLVLAAPELVAVSTRTGLAVDRRTNLFNEDRSKSWATAVATDVELVRSVVDEFNRGKGLLPSEGLYVGATSAWATTIIGPPRLQQELLASKPFAHGFKTTSLPINALFHSWQAPEVDINWIIGTESVLDSLSLTKTVFLSSENGDVFPPQNGVQIIREAVLNILSRITDNSKVFAKVSAFLGHSDARIVPVVAENGAQRLLQALKDNKAYHLHSSS